MSEQQGGNAAVEPTDALNVEERLSLLDKEEKLIVLVGIFLFYGTRHVSEKKIAGLKLILSHLKFDSDKIAHRDPSDEELTLAETTAWVLGVLKSNFADESILSDDAVEPLLRTVMRSLDKDLKKEPEPEMKASRITEGLTKLASLDGKVSENERKLINALKSESRFITGAAWPIFGVLAIGAASAAGFTLFGEHWQIFVLVVLVSSGISALKWISQFFSRAMV